MKTVFQSLVWLGVRTKRFREMRKFYENILKLKLVHKENGFRAYDLPNGDRIELFTESYKSHKFFKSGPVVGFLVDKINETRAEMEKKGIKFIGPIHSGSTNDWSHFYGPDGNVYEITTRKSKKLRKK